MTSLTRALFCSAAFAMVFASAPPVVAQDATLAPMVKAKPKAVKTVAKPVPSDRRPGELEGWTAPPSSGVASPKARRLPPGVVSEKAAPDGGIPLPEQRDPGFAPPVAIDSNGRPSGMFRF